MKTNWNVTRGCKKVQPLVIFQFWELDIVVSSKTPCSFIFYHYIATHEQWVLRNVEYFQGSFTCFIITVHLTSEKNNNNRIIKVFFVCVPRCQSYILIIYTQQFLGSVWFSHSTDQLKDYDFNFRINLWLGYRGYFCKRPFSAETCYTKYLVGRNINHG